MRSERAQVSGYPFSHPDFIRLTGFTVNRELSTVNNGLRAKNHQGINGHGPASRKYYGVDVDLFDV